LQRLVHFFGIDADQQRAFGRRPDEHVAVEHEAEPAEHLFFGETLGHQRAQAVTHGI